jgi:23S rRNA (pseudouridine1915-N3)-methyltransferase
MKLVFLFGGKKGSLESEALGADYLERISHSINAEVMLVPSKAKGEDVKNEESENTLAQIKESDAVILFDERGKQVTSPEYSEILTRLIESGKKRVVIIVGGAYGVSDTVRERADIIIALSKMVFPHEIARIMTLEQTYRALSIRAGMKYHHV